MPNKVTVQDIADALGLSRNTVSKAINNTGILAEDTKNKIIQKAIEMGYKQFTYTNSTEINKKTLQTGEVALFLGSFLSTSHFATTMLDKFQHELSVIGYTLTMHRVTAEDIAQKKLPSSFNPEKTKAIACIEMFNIEYCKFITSMEIPVLMIDAPVSSIWEPLNADLLLMENTSNIYTLIKDMKERGIKVAYLHNETKTLERTQIIYQLRKGKYDVLVGINLLREGLDIPEVSLIAILDADKEGFLRSSRSLIQTIGRAARNVNGRVIMYADEITDSMKTAIDETNRRRSIQIAYNEKNNITPRSIVKEIGEVIHSKETKEMSKKFMMKKSHTKAEKQKLMAQIETEMRQAAKELNFERAAELRDILYEIRDEN